MKRISRLILPLCFSLFVGAAPNATLANDVAASASSPFPVPSGLEPAVQFWKKVFTEFSSTQIIYFDPLDLSKIYEVTEVGEGSRSNEYINAETIRVDGGARLPPK